MPVADAGAEEAAADAGTQVEGFRVHAYEFLSRETFPHGGQVTGLSESGIVSGYAYSSESHRQNWIVRPPEGEVEAWDWANMKPSTVLSLQSDGTYCGSASWPEPELGGFSGTAIIGSGSSGERLLPDPVSSSCHGRNESGVTIGAWKGGFLRWADGEMVSFDFFPHPTRPGQFIYAVGRDINEYSHVVGSVQHGQSLGEGNPAGFFWSKETGPRLLKSHKRKVATSAINDHGVMVGASRDGQDNDVAAVWDSFEAEPRYLPSPGDWFLVRPEDINNAGLIVGSGLDEQNIRRGLVWWKDKVYLADELVGDQLSSSADWYWIERLDFVNDEGRIAGIVREEWREDGAQVVRRRPIVIDVLQLP